MYPWFNPQGWIQRALPWRGSMPSKKKKGTLFLNKIKQKAIGPVSFGLNGTSSCKSKVEGEIVTHEHKKHLVHV